MSEYFLPQHVYVSDGPDALVFLDLRNDEYIMIKGDEADAFRSFFWHSAEAQEKSDPPETGESLPPVLGDLITVGLLTADRLQGKPVEVTDVVTPRTLLSELHDTTAKLSFRDVRRFLAACSTAALRLRFQSIESTISTVRRRKIAKATVTALNWREIERLVVIFNRLRALFPANYLCLFDSLALIEFLARHKLFPTWVFAVQFEPWQAHCWVQEGDISLNEQVEQVERYTPIMAI